MLGEGEQTKLTIITIFLSQVVLSARQELQERQVEALASRESEQMKRFEEYMELKQRQECQTMRDMMDKEWALFWTMWFKLAFMF